MKSDALQCPECEKIMREVITHRGTFLRCSCGVVEIVEAYPVEPDDRYLVKVGWGNTHDRHYMVTIDQMVGATLIFYPQTPEATHEWLKIQGITMDEGGNVRFKFLSKELNAEKVMAGLEAKRITIPRLWRKDLEYVPF